MGDQIPQSGELRAWEPKWYPTFPNTRAHGFSLSDLERDIWEWRAQRGELAERAKQDRALRSLAPQTTRDEVQELTRSNAARRDPNEFIRKLVEETQAIEQPEMRYDSKFGPDPFSRRKTRERLLADTQRLHFLRGMTQGFGAPTQLHAEPERWRGLPDDLRSAMMRYAQDVDRSRSGDESSYESQYIGPGSALGTAMTYLQSTPSMVYSVGEAVNNAVDPVGVQVKSPGEQFMYAFNTLTAPNQTVLAMLGLAPSERGPGWSAWSDQEAVRRSWDKEIPWSDFRPEAARQLRDQAVMDADKQMTGRQYFMNRGFHPTTSALLGGLTDDLFNPAFNAPGIVQASRAKNWLMPVAKQVAIEFAPGVAINTAEGAAGMLSRLHRSDSGER